MESLLSSYSLDPLQIKKPLMVERSDLDARRERIGTVLPIARIEMLGLSRQMLHTQYGIMLTDQDGVILSYVGDPAVLDDGAPQRFPRRRHLERAGARHQWHGHLPDDAGSRS